MIREITEYEKEMDKKCWEWYYMDDNGVYHLKDDAPDDVKKYHEQMKKEYNY